jgi:glycine/D-amino acid oxidase-like deaminating enzyme
VTPTRRHFLSAALVGLGRKSDRPIAGSFVDNTHILGHRLRDRASFPAPKHIVKIPVVIVGGGVAGLSAAWHFARRGFRDFVVLEMESQPGGNSRWAENEVSAYPWAAHYVPVPDKRSTLVRELFEDLGVLRDGVWEERYLCFSPQERLFLHGRWQEGLEPAVGLTVRDHEQFRIFEERVEELRGTGQFTIPTEAGKKPSALDAISISDWLQNHKLTSVYLNWYINYCCRDDYGASAADTSAWAGIHYFASRNPDDKGPLTWPEGNGWIVRRMLERIGPHMRTSTTVTSILRDRNRLRVRTEDTEYVTEAVVFAAPTFLASYLTDFVPPARLFQYSPWLTANLTLDRLPRERGIEPAWDNVIYDSPALGYVVATHQTVRSRIDRTVWTYYWALADGPPARYRALLLEKDWGHWKEAILRDLSRAHPDIRNCVSRIDIMRLGHAMIRPAPGFISSEERRRFAGHTVGNLFLANSDLSGLSLFEEAQYWGVKAAGRALRVIGRAA